MTKIVLSLLLLAAGPGAFGAEVPVSMTPSGTASVSGIPSEPSSRFQVRRDSKTLTVIRDAGVGLGAGALMGLGFIAMSPGGFSSNNAPMKADALATGLVVGLVSGIVTGIWENKTRVSGASSSGSY